MYGNELTALINENRHQELIKDAAHRRLLKPLLGVSQVPSVWQRLKLAIGSVASTIEHASQFMKSKTNPRTLQ